MSKKLRVVFMGTPPFAVAILDQIQKAGHEVVYVVTVPDKPAGRGRQLRMSAVKEYALQHALPVLQPEKLRDEVFVSELKAADADVFVVVAFRMLPEVVWRIPKIGTFNLHASLLPDYRGAAPINWTIINGEQKTGVTTFFINEQIDTGAILMQEEVDIATDETAGSLHDKLMKTGAALVVKTLAGLANNTLVAQQQPLNGEFKPAPKIFKEDCQLDWHKPGKQIEQHIRGLSPYPGAFTVIEEGEITGVVKIGGGKFIAQRQNQNPGKMWVEGKQIFVSVLDGVLEIQELQPEGKRMMKAPDFINGLRNKERQFSLAQQPKNG